MAGLRITDWRKLPISLTELCLATTLRCGQSFRWRQNEDRVWSCTLRGRVVQLTQDPQHVHYRAIFSSSNEAPPTPPSSAPPSIVEDSLDDTRDLLQHYLNLEPNLADLYTQWSAADTNFRKKAPKFTGVRILRQDAWEALICFICSSNNNIIRISQMVDKLCKHYGPLIGHFEGQTYHDFPHPTTLTGKSVETHLRELGFGYRARYIHQTACMVAQERPAAWLDSLRNPESPAFGSTASPAGPMTPSGRSGYRTAHEALLELQGVGPKVADCVALMGLGWGESVPVDTHVWQIAQRDYKFGKGKHSSLTKATYDAVADHFRKLWGQEAGWAHSVLFTADLRVFADQLNQKVEIKVEKDEGRVGVMKETTVVRTAAAGGVKRKAEMDDEYRSVEAAKPVVKVEEIAITSSERVKRRRR